LAEAFIVSSLSIHLPSAPAATEAALAVFSCPANLTVIFSPAVAQPHTGTGMPAWMTIFSLNTAGIRTAAIAGQTMAIMHIAARAAIRIFMPFVLVVLTI
jgi:hypothetical protein